MIPEDVLTAGALRALLAGAPDGDPVMVAIDGQAAAWARHAVHDPGGRTFDVLAGRLPADGATLAASTAPVRARQRRTADGGVR